MAAIIEGPDRESTRAVRQCLGYNRGRQEEDMGSIVEMQALGVPLPRDAFE